MTTPDKSLNVDDAIAADRRQFVKQLGFAVLTVQVFPSLVQAETDPPNGDDHLTIHSGPGAFGHVHELLVPYAVLSEPPREGVKLISSKAFLHTHDVALTQQELLTVNQGGTVTKASSSHRFVIARGSSQPHR